MTIYGVLTNGPVSKDVLSYWAQENSTTYMGVMTSEANALWCRGLLYKCPILIIPATVAYIYTYLGGNVFLIPHWVFSFFIGVILFSCILVYALSTQPKYTIHARFLAEFAEMSELARLGTELVAHEKLRQEDIHTAVDTRLRLMAQTIKALENDLMESSNRNQPVSGIQNVQARLRREFNRLHELGSSFCELRSKKSYLPE